MPIRVYYEVLNQKGTPALYSDNYASRPAAGYTGRIFYSPDTAQIFYDTGTTWTLLADAGVGSGSLASVCANGNTTATGIVITANGLSTNSLTSTNLTAGSIPFIGTGGLFSQDNTNLFWDNTNKYFGINTNTPSTYLDVHGTNNVLVQINNSTTADSKIAFLNASVGKWRIGNLYSSGNNLFHIYNNTAGNNAMTINSVNSVTFTGSVTTVGLIADSLQIVQGTTIITSGRTGIGALVNGLTIGLDSGVTQQLYFPTATAYIYTYPSATGTLVNGTSFTSGVIPKYSGTAGVLTASMLSDDGTTLVSAGATRSNLYLKAVNNTYYSQLAFTNGSNGSFGGISYNNSGQYMQFEVNSSEYMRYYSNGNLRLFSSSSVDNGNKLQVEGYLSANRGIFGLAGDSSTNPISTSNAAGTQIVSNTTRTGGGGWALLNNGGDRLYLGSANWVGVTGYSTSDNSICIASAQNASIVFAINAANTSSSEKWKIDTNGYFVSAGSSQIQLTGNSPMYFAVGSTVTGALGGSDLLIANLSNSGGVVVTTRNPIVGVALSNGATSWSAYSDERLKTDIEDIDNAIDKLTTLRTIKYHLKDIDQTNDKKRLGLIAQDLVGKFDEVLDTDRSDFYQVRYTDLIPVLVKAVQELNQKIENLN